MNFFTQLIIAGCLGSVFVTFSMEYNDHALLDLARNDPQFLSSPATIPLLSEHEQKELACMASSAQPDQKRKTTQESVQEKLLQLHTANLLSMEPTPTLVRVSKMKQIANCLSSKIHATADGKMLVNSYAGAFDITGQEYMPLDNDQRSRVRGWIIGGSETILYQLTGASRLEHDTITVWDLASKKPLYGMRLPQCFWDHHTGKNNKWFNSIQPTEEEKRNARQLLTQVDNTYGYLSLLPSHLRIEALGSYLSAHHPFFDTFAVDKKDKLFAMHTIEGTTKIVDAQTGKVIRSLPGSAPYNKKKAGIFSGDNKWFISRLRQENGNGMIEPPQLLVWNLEDKAKLPICIEGDVASFSHDSSRVASASSVTKQLQIWNTSGLIHLATMALNYSPVALRFNPKGDRLLVKSRGPSYAKNITSAQEIWDLDTLTCFFAHLQDRLREVNSEQDLVVSTAKTWNSKTGQLCKKQTKIKHVPTGQKLILGTEGAEQFAFDGAGNYLLVTRSVTSPELYHAKTCCLIKILKGKEEYCSFEKAKLNSFLSDNKLVTLNDNEAAVWQLYPIEWSKVSPQEKMAMLILEHNYRTGTPFSKAAIAQVSSLQAIAQQHYPQSQTLSNDTEPAIGMLEKISEKMRKDEYKDGLGHQFCAHDTDGNIIFAEMMLTGPHKGKVSASVHPQNCISRGSGGYSIIDLAPEHARRFYYLMHQRFNEQPKD